jgi:hypothetical protein
MFTFIGIIATIIFLKFIYDTFLTNNANKNWNEYKSENPEKAARIERNTGLNFNTKPNSNLAHKLASLQMLAEHYGCNASDVKDVVMNEFKANYQNYQELTNLLEKFKIAKGTESIQYDIDPEDTPNAYLYNWALELRTSIIQNMFKLPPEADDPNELSDFDKEITLELRNHMENDMAKSIFKIIESQINYLGNYFIPLSNNGRVEVCIFNTIIITCFFEDYNSILGGKVRHRLVNLAIEYLISNYNIPKQVINSIFTERESQIQRELELMRDSNLMPIKFYNNFYLNPLNNKTPETSLENEYSRLPEFHIYLNILIKHLNIEFNLLEDENPDFKTTCIV